MQLAALDEQKLSECVSPYERIPIQRSIPGLKGKTITMGASDGCLANLGSDATSAGELSITIGTSGAVRMMSPSSSRDPQLRLFNYRLDDKAFVTGGATNNGTVVIDWFVKNFYKKPEITLSQFGKEIASIHPGSEGLLFLPFVFGERAPHYNPDLRGVFFGLAQHHTLSHMARSVVEGICFEIRALVHAVEETLMPAHRIMASGGFIRSEEWVQLLADVLGKEVMVRDVNDASSMGAAIVGFRSMNEQAVFKSNGTEKVFRPDLRHQTLYDRLYSIFVRMPAKMGDEFNEMAALQMSVKFQI
jgi:gluconokinase